MSLLQTSDGTSTLQSSKDQSTNFNFETSSSLLTDITSTLSSTFTETDHEKSQHVTKELLVKKQLLHDIQKLKIELSQKSLLVDTLKAEHLNRIDDLEDQLSDAVHTKQLLHAKYETQIQILRDNSEKAIKKLKNDLKASLELQKIYHEKCISLSDKAAVTKATFNEGINISEEQYNTLKMKSEDDLSLQELFSLHIYEKVNLLQIQIESLSQRNEMLAADLRDKEEELSLEKQEHESERHARVESELRYQKLQVQLEDLRTQLSHKYYRNDNFDNVISERDALERKITELEKQNTVYKNELDEKSTQMELLKQQIAEFMQTIALLKQDKDYLSKQLNELSPRYKFLEERHHIIETQLDNVKASREELYEKFLSSRDHYKHEYEEKLKKELDEVSNKTNIELQRLKEMSKEVYERENRSLRESKEMAVLESERLMQSEKQIQQKYSELLSEFRLLQISTSSKVSEKENESQMKSFELDRIQLLHEEAMKNCKQMSLQNETLSKKVETLSKEYYALKAYSDKQISELEAKNQEFKSKLTIYEKLEQELDDVVMQAAELTNEVEGEKVLFAYGYGANIPSTAKRRMQQSVQLARRVLQLERANTSLRSEVERESTKCKQMTEELKQSNSLLNEAQQPYNYLIESIRTRDAQNQLLKETISNLENDIRKLKLDNEKYITCNNQMSADLERLLNQREEMTMMKEIIIKLKSNTNETMNTVSSLYESQKNNDLYKSQKNDDLNIRLVKPILFTNAQLPSWYQKLRRQNDSLKSLK
ncbi:progesterone-induced-blocking factor 1 isoform X1 [Hydra vulgaris]|uniref:Progesterone-induced-blocking factor 1 n=1 Tax=Hydra vulgaris TaxID=6087 RepID=T2M8F5_HYDVU|nr:progesterone-induced-blocking factor 1 [Hydra vulgaris]